MSENRKRPGDSPAGGSEAVPIVPLSETVLLNAFADCSKDLIAFGKHIAIRCGLSPTDAEDCVGEVITILLRYVANQRLPIKSIGQGFATWTTGEGPFSKYYEKCVKNRAYRFYREATRARLEVLYEGIDSSVEGIYSPLLSGTSKVFEAHGLDPTQAAIANEELELVNCALAKMPARERDAFCALTKHELYGGWDIKQVAVLHGISLSSAYAAGQKAIAALAQLRKNDFVALPQEESKQTQRRPKKGDAELVCDLVRRKQEQGMSLKQAKKEVWNTHYKELGKAFRRRTFDYWVERGCTG